MIIETYTNTKKDLAIAKARLKELEITKGAIQEQINNQKGIVEFIEKQHKIIEKTIKELNSIELDLFKKIVFESESVSRAVNLIAETYDKDVSTIWRVYSKRVKERVKQLRKNA